MSVNQLILAAHIYQPKKNSNKHFSSSVRPKKKIFCFSGTFFEKNECEGGGECFCIRLKKNIKLMKGKIKFDKIMGLIL